MCVLRSRRSPRQGLFGCGRRLRCAIVSSRASASAIYRRFPWVWLDIPHRLEKKPPGRRAAGKTISFAPIPPPVLPGSGSKGPFSAPTGAPLRCLQQVEATYLGRLNSVSGQFASGHCHGARAKSLFQCHPRESGGPEKTLEYLNSGFRRNDHKGTLSAFLDTLLRRAIEIHQSYNISVKQTSTLVWQKFPRQPSGVLNLVKPSGRPGKALDNTLPTAILRG
jgi:hypothetical protein